GGNVDLEDGANTLRLLAASCMDNEDEARQLRAVLERAHSALFVGPDSVQFRFRANLTIRLCPGPTGALFSRPMQHLDQNWEAIVANKRDEKIAARWAHHRLPNITFCPETWPRKGILVYCDALITQALTEAISNVMHRPVEIPCPWAGYADLNHADMWIRT